MGGLLAPTEQIERTWPPPEPARRLRGKPPGLGRPFAERWLPYLMWVAFAGVYSTLSLTRFARLSTPSWDNAIFQQAISAYAHFRAPIVDIKGPGYLILGDHFSPILALLAPIYRVFPFAQTLLVAQAVLITVALVPITRIAVERLGAAGGSAVAVAFALSFGIQSAVFTDFHEVAFAAPLVAFGGAAFLRRRWKAVAWWSLPLLLVKEDLGITVAAIGLVLVLVGARRVGVALLASGIVGFLLVVFVVVPAFNQHGTFDYWGSVSFGTAGPSALETFFTGWDLKTVTLLLTFGITGFLALRSPWVLVALPTLGWRWIGENSTYWDTNFHYSLILMPIVFLAMLDAIQRVRDGRGGPAWLRRYVAHAPTAALAVALALCLQFPINNLFKAETYQANPDAVAADAAVALMPKGSSVETNLGLITHLVSDYQVYWTGTVGSAVPDYVLIDTRSAEDIKEVATWAEQQHPGVDYRQIYDSDGYLLAVKVG
ncbi:putative membrane protein [Nakamurella sp. UYEF19]|uniref:DUF2079 domain-containing protein n=1 Tax=Nakamurella sp. UYEF19 TaxID=1756392 RepID=UPI003398D728